MDLASTVLARLSLETRVHHDAADALWRSLSTGTPTRQDYVRALVATYGFEAPLEAALAYTPGLRDAIDVRARCRAGLLAQDLLVLELTPSAVARLPHCFPIAPFSAPIEALGWMYVAERATLLYPAVRRHLAAHVSDVAHALSYLDAYRDVVGARWQELGHALDRVATTDSQRDALVAAAHAGFRCLLEWRSGHRDVFARGA